MSIFIDWSNLTSLSLSLVIYQMHLFTLKHQLEQTAEKPVMSEPVIYLCNLLQVILISMVFPYNLMTLNFDHLAVIDVLSRVRFEPISQNRRFEIFN